MSITDTVTAPQREKGPSSWAPEINDLQKYRDSLKVMAERVSQAEFMWAKSLEPSHIPQSPPSQKPSLRKQSKSKRPTPLQKPFLPKRIRTDSAMPSPDPFRLLSPAVHSDEEAFSPTLVWSSNTSPIEDPISRLSRPQRRRGKNSSCDLPSPDGNAHMPVRRAEDVLDEVLGLVNGARDAARSMSRKNAIRDPKLFATARDASNRTCEAKIQVKALMVEAHRRPESLFADALSDDEQLAAISSDPRKGLAKLSAKLERWKKEVSEAEESSSRVSRAQRLATPESAS